MQPIHPMVGISLMDSPKRRYILLSLLRQRKGDNQMKHTLADYTEQAQKTANQSNGLWLSVNKHIAWILQSSNCLNEAIKRLEKDCPRPHQNEPVSIGNIRTAIFCMKRDIDLTLL